MDRVKTSKTHPNISRKEALLVTIEKKRQCEAKALRIVESLLETTVTEEYLRSVVNFIRQEHYQDIIEERSILKICGYPLCSNPLGKITSQKYHISSKHNKVYDITERKCFCSNICYKASKFFEHQLLSSPVWLEDEEIEAVNFLPINANDGSLGIQVEFEKLSLRQELQELENLDAKGGDSSSTLKPVSPKIGKKVILKSLQKLARHIDKENRLRNASSTRSSTETSKGASCNENEMKLSNTPTSAHASLLENNSSDSQKELSVPRKEGDSTELKSETNFSSETNKANNVQFNKNRSNSEELDSDDLSDDEPNAASDTKDVREISMDSVVSCSLKKGAFAKWNNKEKTKPISSNVTKDCDSPVDAVKNVDLSNARDNQSEKLDILNPTVKQLNSKTITSSVRKKNYSNNILSGSRGQQNFTNQLVIKITLENLFREWITLETVQYIYGKEKFHKLLVELECDERVEQLKKKSDLENSEFYKQQYVSLCQKLDQEEAKETHLDFQFVNGLEQDSEKEPLPQYEKLLENASSQDLKVKAFYKGQLEILENTERTIKGKKRKEKSKKKMKDSIQEVSEKEMRSVSLPLVDSISQKTLRCQIVMDRLNYYISDLLHAVGIYYKSLTFNLRELIYTFRLSSRNITFKPIEWTFIALITINMIALKDVQLQQHLQTDSWKRFVQMLFKKLNLEAQYLDEILPVLLDINGILERSESKYRDSVHVYIVPPVWKWL